MSDLTITTIIPAYRAARTIERAVDSALQQSYPAHEILIIDDGSPDELAQVVQRYGNRVKLIQKPNGGAASARNLGLDRATGAVIAFLDADDYWEPGKLERQVAVLRQHPEVGITCSRWFEQMPSEGRTVPPVGFDADYDRVLTATSGTLYSLVGKMWTCTILVRREVIGSQRFMCGLEPAEDRDMWIRLITSAPLYIDSVPLATYVQEPGSLSRTNVDRDYGNMLRVVQGNRSFLGSRQTRIWEEEVYRRWAARHLANGQPRSAVKAAWHRLRKNPVSLEGWWVFLKSGLRVCSGS